MDHNDKLYIDLIRNQFYPDLPIQMFRSNFRSSAKELKVAEKINENNRDEYIAYV